MKFRVMVPIHGGDVESLGVFEAECLPRVGDAFLVDHPRVCPKKHVPLEAKVDAVVWESVHEDGTNRAAPPVWLAENAACVWAKVWCVCTDASRVELRKGHEGDAEYVDSPDGLCFNCGDDRKPAQEILF